MSAPAVARAQERSDMSYLLGPRLHFAGRFKADVSTVNNDPTHFNDATFKPEFQTPQTPGHPNGWWNPRGSASWQLISCAVTGAVFSDGTLARAPADDPVVGLAVMDAESLSAKIVDLDPEQQAVSQIWGLQVRVGKAGANPAFSGKFEVAAFSDLWDRSPGGNGDSSKAAFWQSVLTDVTWADLANSRLLQELKQAATGGLLSIKFNVDSFNMDSRSPIFATGRIVGTIGAALAGEPHQFVLGRHCMPLGAAPVSVNFFPAAVDERRGKLVADLGNALPTPASDGPVDSSLQLEVGLLADQQFTTLGQVNIGGAGWYEQTAAICEFPADRRLSAAELAALRTTPIALVVTAAGETTLLAREGTDGLHIRADRFVYRMSPGDQATATLYASRFGQPLANASVAVSFNSSMLQGANGNLQVAKPTSALTFPLNLTTDQKGTAVLTLAAHTLGRPRQYIDGQVYGVGYGLPQSAQGAGGYSNPWNFISILIWSSFTMPASPNWWGDIHPIMQQYANLYPFMKNFFNLGDYNDVVANIPALRGVFTLPEEHPHYMPVTRDLSPAKRQTILSWLATTGNAGKPNLGTPPPAMVAARAPAAIEAEASGEGKTAALRRRAPRPIVLTRA